MVAYLDLWNGQSSHFVLQFIKSHTIFPALLSLSAQFSLLFLLLSLQMGDSSKSQTSNLYSILGIPKSASLSEICKAYKSLVKKWHPDRHPSNRTEAQAKFCSINEAYRVCMYVCMHANLELISSRSILHHIPPLRYIFNNFQTLSLKKREEASLKNREEAHACNGDRKPKHKKKKSHDNERAKAFQISQPTLLSRTMSHATSPTSSNGGNIPPPPPVDIYASFGGNQPTTHTDNIPLPKAPSRRCTTPIFFSQSAARVKPPPIERKIECTLEELFLGCVKKIKITRDAFSSSGYDSFNSSSN